MVQLNIKTRNRDCNRYKRDGRHLRWHNPSSVTVTTDNQEITLHNGESQTIEDASTDSVWLYENAGYDHNYHSYYGISGNWEVTVIGGGEDGGDGTDTLGTEDTTDWVVWGVVAAVIIGLAAAVVILLIKRKPSTSNPPQP